MRRIVVAIDPAISVSEASDATGIVVAGVGDDGHGYILEDISGKYSPTGWARAAIAAYKRHHGDRIVAEANQGRAMVETTLRAVDPAVPVRLVHASRGKITRAEPISALFEQHRAHLVGGFPELEDELCSFEPGSSDSPDRLDAMVWALTDLMVGFVQPMSFHVPIVSSRPSAFAGGGYGGVFADTSKPGGWPAGSPQAGGMDAMLWNMNSKPRPPSAEDLRREAKRIHFRDGSSFIPEEY